RLHLQRPGRADRGRRVVSHLRAAPEPHHRECGDDTELGLGHWQRPASAAAGPVRMREAASIALMRWPASPFGYTRNVLSWSHGLTCVALAFALSGSPAMLAACMALCVDSPVMTTAGRSGHG